MFSLNGKYFEKKWVGRATGNETIYWDGLANYISGFPWHMRTLYRELMAKVWKQAWLI